MHAASAVLSDVSILHEFEVVVPITSRLRVEFPSSTDFYGRIVVYKFFSWGSDNDEGGGAGGGAGGGEGERVEGATA
jgi:hypothetical protein